MWDVTYAMVISMPAESRRQHGTALIDEYYDHLTLGHIEHGVKFSREQAHIDVGLLSLVLLAFSQAVIFSRAWDQQGNSVADACAWMQQVLSAARDQLNEASAQSLGISLSTLSEFWKAAELQFEKRILELQS